MNDLGTGKPWVGWIVPSLLSVIMALVSYGVYQHDRYAAEQAAQNVRLAVIEGRLFDIDRRLDRLEALVIVPTVPAIRSQGK